MKLLTTIFIVMVFVCSTLVRADDTPILQAVQLYSQDELLELIRNNQHLQRVEDDRCQLNRDIEDRAIKLDIPAYQFLYGDMLAWGVCLTQDPKRGLLYINKAADQGLVAAIEQLGRYYHIGRFVQKDEDKAYKYIYRAAELGHLNAQFRLISMQLDGLGSPIDYENSYRWLHHAVIADTQEHKQATNLLSQLAQRMPERVVRNAKN